MTVEASRDSLPRRRSARLAIAVLALAILGLFGSYLVRLYQTSLVEKSIRQGEALVKAGQYDEAESIWRGMVRTDRDCAPAWEMLAKLYIGTRNYGNAIEPLRNVVRLTPDTPGVNSKLAECLRRTGDRAGALTQAREALKRNPNDPAALATASVVLKEMDQGSEELVYTRRLAQVRPNDPNALMMVAAGLQRTGSYAESMPILDTLIRLDPANANSYRLRGVALFYMDHSPTGSARAIEDFEKSLQLNPAGYTANLYLGRVYTRIGQPVKAIPLLETARQLSPSRGDADFALAEAYDLVGEHDRARASRKAFVAWRREFDEAMVLEKRLAVRPAIFEYNLRLGKIKLHERDFNAASHYLSIALQTKPDDPDARAAYQQLNSEATSATPQLLGGGQ